MYTVIRCNPGQQRGKLRGYTITQVCAGVRKVYEVIALNGKQAIECVKNMQVAA